TCCWLNCARPDRPPTATPRRWPCPRNAGLFSRPRLRLRFLRSGVVRVPLLDRILVAFEFLHLTPQLMHLTLQIFTLFLQSFHLQCPVFAKPGLLALIPLSFKCSFMRLPDACGLFLRAGR